MLRSPNECHGLFLVEGPPICPGVEQLLSVCEVLALMPRHPHLNRIPQVVTRVQRVGAIVDLLVYHAVDAKLLVQKLTLTLLAILFPIFVTVILCTAQDTVDLHHTKDTFSVDSSEHTNIKHNQTLVNHFF